jgi:hypothetical protein
MAALESIASRPFSSLSLSRQSRIANAIGTFAVRLSGGEPRQLGDYLASRSRAGKLLFPPALHTAREQRVLANIRDMHASAATSQRSSLLALVAGEHSRAELAGVGFNFSSTQLATAVGKAACRDFGLSGYQRHTPAAHAPVSDAVKELIITYLIRNSRQSCLTTPAVDAIPCLSNQVYHLEVPKRCIYDKIMTDHPGTKLSLSTFYKICPKNFRKPRKKTDMCQVKELCADSIGVRYRLTELVQVCVVGEKIKRQFSSAMPGTATYDHLKKELEVYRCHLYFKDKQQQLYRQSVARTTPTSCVVTMDFKQNMCVGGGPVETGRVYYAKKQVSVLGIAVHYRDDMNNLRVRYVDFLSEILSHDSLFAGDCLTKLCELPFMRQFREICIWADAGPHFRSGEFMHHVFRRLPMTHPARFYMNYFAEQHGKNICDSHFGVLSRWHKEGEASRDIRNIGDLLTLFQAKADAQAQRGEGANADTVFEIYSRDTPRSDIHRLVVPHFRAYMGFAMASDERELLASTTSTLNAVDYMHISCSVRVVKDDRRTKYAPATRTVTTADIDTMMGSRSRLTQAKRAQLTPGITTDQDGDIIMTDGE